MCKMKDNILAVYEQATTGDVIDGTSWYLSARNECQAIADEHELPLHIVVGVVAALSPTNKWARNILDAEAMCYTFTQGGYKEDCTPSTYKTMRDKAWSILADMPYKINTAVVLNGPKITDFYHCILGHNVCVIDGHAWCIAHNDRRTLQEIPNIGKKKRIELQEAYRQAAEEKDMAAYEMQAITWLTWKRIHGV